MVEKYAMTAEFTEQRRAALTVFINRVVRGGGGGALPTSDCCTASGCSIKPAAARTSAASCLPAAQPCLPPIPPPPPPPPAPQAVHPVLKLSHDLQLFLEASETEFGIEVSRSQLDDPAVAQVGGRSLRSLFTAPAHFQEPGQLAVPYTHWRPRRSFCP